MFLSMINGTMPYRWVASLYFFQSLPFVVVSLIAALLYQYKGIDNGQALFLASVLTLPWVIKPLFAPLLEKFTSKKRLTLLAQLAVSLVFLLLGLAVNHSCFIAFSIVAFACLALLSSLHDIVTDGLYIQNLDATLQKRYIPFRTLFYQLGRFTINGALLVLVGRMGLYLGLDSWQVFFFCLFAITLSLTIYHYYQLPDLKQEHHKKQNDSIAVFKHLFSDSRIISPLCFLFFYNMSDAQMQRMIPLYLMDKNGLNFSLNQVGDSFGMTGTCALLLGVFIGGHLLTLYSLKSCIKGLTFLGFLGPLMFLTLQYSPLLIIPAILLTQIIMGMANAAYMAYMLSLSNNTKYPMSAYTFFTAMMALSFVFFTAVSGFVQQALGYHYFFVYLLLTSIVVFFMTIRMVNNDA